MVANHNRGIWTPKQSTIDQANPVGGSDISPQLVAAGAEPGFVVSAASYSRPGTSLTERNQVPYPCSTGHHAPDRVARRRSGILIGFDHAADASPQRQASARALSGKELRSARPPAACDHHSAGSECDDPRDFNPPSLPRRGSRPGQRGGGHDCRSLCHLPGPLGQRPRFISPPAPVWWRMEGAADKTQRAPLGFGQLALVSTALNQRIRHLLQMVDIVGCHHHG